LRDPTGQSAMARTSNAFKYFQQRVEAQQANRELSEHSKQLKRAALTLKNYSGLGLVTQRCE